MQGKRLWDSSLIGSTPIELRRRSRRLSVDVVPEKLTLNLVEKVIVLVECGVHMDACILTLYKKYLSPHTYPQYRIPTYVYINNIMWL